MTYLLSVDPGGLSGISFGRYSETKPYERTHFWAIQNGLEGFCQWVKYHFFPDFYSNKLDFFQADGLTSINMWSNFKIVSERFVLRSNQFVADITPARIEGAMMAFGLDPIYQLRSDKALVPDKILKDNGLWVTGKQCNWKDGRDVNDSTIHALAFLKKQKHVPTIEKYWSSNDES